MKILRSTLIAVLVAVSLLAATSFATASQTLHWITVSRAPYLHRYYLNATGNVLGEYSHPTGFPFTAQCYIGGPHEFADEPAAVNYILQCPKW